MVGFYKPFIVRSLILFSLAFSGSVLAQKAGYPDWFLATESLTDLTFSPILEKPIVHSSNNPLGEKPQSKVWEYAGKWWCVFPTDNVGASSQGTWLWRLDDDHWTEILKLSSEVNTKSDAKRVGGVTHILIHDSDPQLASVEYVPATMTYQFWSQRPANVDISLPGSEIASIDIDSQNRMWLATENSSNARVHYSDFPYSSWTGPIDIGSLASDDITVVTAFNDSTIGVLWSDQDAEEFKFRFHHDGDDPNTWSSQEIAASGNLFADDHMNVASYSDGTLYAAIKTSTDFLGLLIRRPNGTWDEPYIIDGHFIGTRPVVLLNEVTEKVSVVYQEKNGENPIVYRESPISSINFGPRTTLIDGAYSNVSSTKENFTNEIVIIASNRTDPKKVVGVIGVSPVVPFTRTINAGWNLVGLPNTPADPHYQTLFPASNVNTLFGYANGYVSEDTLEAGLGYWLEFPTAGQVSVSGDSIANVSINLAPGWNLFSGPSCDLPISAIADAGSVIIPGSIWGYNAGYFNADSIKQGCSYWVEASAVGTITMSCSTTVAASANRFFAAQSLLKSAESGYPALMISEKNGQSLTLFFDAQLDDPGLLRSYHMPPIAPAGGFDVRYDGDMRLTEAAEAVILIQSNHFPVTIEPQNLSIEPGDSYQIQEMLGREVIATHPLREGEPVFIDNQQVRRLKLTRTHSISAIPQRFSLFQNYPNPFNPSTTLRYQLPVDSRIELAIFNAAGQKIKTLVDAAQTAGSHEIRWNGLNNAGLSVSSGVYFFRITAKEHGNEAQGFTETRRMLLLK